MRTRLIHPDFFKHEGLAQLPPLHRLLFQGLWGLADRDGRLEDRPIRIHAEVLPYDEGADVSAMLTALSEAGFIVRYAAAGRRFIAIPSFSRWQNPHRKEKPSVIPPPEEGTESSPVITRLDPVITRPDRAVSNTVSDPVTDPDPKDLAASDLKPSLSADASPPETEFMAFVRLHWPDVKHSREYEKRAREAFPAVDPLVEARKALGWELSSPQHKKHNHGKFFWNWLARAQDSASRGGGQAQKRRVIAMPGKPEDFNGPNPF